ncbi:phosphatase PAP2 family protein [Clostridium sp. LBM24168]
MFSLVYQFDFYLLQFIEKNMHSIIIDKIMIAITYLGNMGIIWIIIALFLIINKRYRKAGIVTLISVILGAILSEGIIKHVVERPRPFVKFSTINLLISKPLSYSFPSGHTTAAFAAAGILSKYFRRYSIEIFTAAFLIAFSRLYLYVHYPTDILSGMILGLLCSKATLYIFK